MKLFKFGGSLAGHIALYRKVIARCHQIATPAVAVIGTGCVPQLEALVTAGVYGNVMEVPLLARLGIANCVQEANEHLFCLLSGSTNLRCKAEAAHEEAAEQKCFRLIDVNDYFCRNNVEMVYGSDCRAAFLSNALNIREMVLVKSFDVASLPNPVPYKELQKLHPHALDYGFAKYVTAALSISLLGVDDCVKYTPDLWVSKQKHILFKTMSEFEV